MNLTCSRVLEQIIGKEVRGNLEVRKSLHTMIRMVVIEAFTFVKIHLPIYLNHVYVNFTLIKLLF